MPIVANSWLASCEIVEETGVPSENHPLTPQVTANEAWNIQEILGWC